MNAKPTAKNALISLGVFFGLCVLIGGSISGGPKPGIVSAREYGDDWPLTVETATLDCLHDGARVITIDRGVFALNGIALGKGFSSPDYYLKPNRRFPDVKASTDMLIARAGELCN